MLLELSHRLLYNTVLHAASLPDVRSDVLSNHDNNRWWPTTIKDWRLRMVLAGWSTRVSYSSIEHYQRVASAIADLGYEALVATSDTALFKIVTPIGLQNSRTEYLRSLDTFIRRMQGEGIDPISYPSDKLIEAFARDVKGASYKVAQCAVLYAKGYHCGIFPVDSGMCEMLQPMLPRKVSAYPKSHEDIRKHLELVITTFSKDYHKLLRKLGYNLTIPLGNAPTWWVHLVIIYYKRRYWNRGLSALFPRAGRSVNVPYAASSKLVDPFLIILEGMDGCGKTTIADMLEDIGYSRVHSHYVSNHTSIFSHYQQQFDSITQPTVLDRTYISELVYGPVYRNGSRLSEEQAISLAKFASKHRMMMFYLYEAKTLLSSRGYPEIPKASGPSLREKYEIVVNQLSEAFPVYWLSSSKLTPLALNFLFYPLEAE